MKYILSGDAKEVEKVMRENRIRVARGLIKFEPVPAEEAEDAKAPVTDTKAPVTDTKDVENPVDNTKEPAEDTKEPAEDAKEPKVADTKSPKKTTKK